MTTKNIKIFGVSTTVSGTWAGWQKSKITKTANIGSCKGKELSTCLKALLGARFSGETLSFLQAGHVNSLSHKWVQMHSEQKLSPQQGMMTASFIISLHKLQMSSSGGLLFFFGSSVACRRFWRFNLALSIATLKIMQNYYIVWFNFSRKLDSQSQY